MISSDETIKETLTLIEDCLKASPLRRFSHLFEPSQLDERCQEAFVAGFEAFLPDLLRWSRPAAEPKSVFEDVLLVPHLTPVYFYRLSRALHLRGIERKPDVLAALSRFMTGVEIYYSADIGPGFKVSHGLGSVIGAHCRAGSHLTIYQGVTLGDKLAPQTGINQRPTLGDHVIIGAGASILGPVRVGSQVVIGAHALVIDSLPDRCVALGSPARVKAELSDEEYRRFVEAIHG